MSAESSDPPDTSMPRYDFVTLDLLPIAAYLIEVDAQGAARLVHASHEFEELTGLAEGMSHRDAAVWEECIHPDDLSAYRASLDDLLGHGRKQDVEYRFRRGDGWIWLRDRTTAIHDAERAPTVIYGLLADVTERQEALIAAQSARAQLESAVDARTAELEHALADLRESEAVYRDLFETLPDAVFLMTENYLDCNEQACRMTGGTKQGLLGHSPADWAPPRQPDGRDSSVAAKAYIDAAMAGEPQEFAWRGVTAGGEPIDTFVTLRSVVIGGRKVLRAIVHDTSDLRRMEAALALSEQQFGSLVAQSSDGIMLIDTDGTLLECNAAMERLTGVPRAEVIGRPSYEFIARMVASSADTAEAEGSPLEWVRRAVMAALADRDAPVFHSSHRATFRHPDGGLRHAEQTLFPISAGERHMIGAIMHDVTEQVASAEAQRDSAERVARALEGAITALGATIELRDPYTAGHQRRVAQLADAIAVELGLDGNVERALHTAALLHDIGKIVVPAEILSRPGRLSELDMMVVREHAAAGAAILTDIDFEGPVAATIAQHHERLDGSGYPAGLSGDRILLEARVLAVADVVEAMVSHRPYRPALGIDDALKEIAAGAGTRYDARVCAACERLFAEGRFAFNAEWEFTPEHRLHRALVDGAG